MYYYLKNKLKNRLISNYQLLLTHSPIKNTKIIFIGLLISKFIVFMLTIVIAQMLLKNFEVLDIYLKLLIFLFVFLHLEFMVKKPKVILAHFNSEWVRINSRSIWNNLILEIVNEYLFFYYVYFDKLVGILLFLSFFNFSLALSLLFACTLFSLFFLLIGIYRCKKKDLVKKQTGLKSSSSITYCLKAAIGMGISYIFLEFIIDSFTLLKTILKTKGLSANSMNVLNDGLFIQWSHKSTKFIKFYQGLNQYLSQKSNIIFILLILSILIAVISFYLKNKLEKILIISEFVYTTSANKNLLLNFWEYVGGTLKVKSTFFYPQLNLIKNSKELAERDILSFFISIQTIMYLWISCIFLNHIENPILKSFFIVFLVLVIAMSIIQDIQYKFLTIFRYEVDTPSIYLFKLSGTSLKNLYMVKKELLLAMSVTPIIISSLLLTIIAFYFIHNLWGAIATSFLIILVAIWSYIIGNKMSVFVGPYIYSKSLLNFLSNNYVNETDSFEEKIYLRIYSFWKNILILPWYYLLLFNGIISFIPTDLTYLLFIGFFIFIVIFNYAFIREEKNLLLKGVYLFENISL